MRLALVVVSLAVVVSSSSAMAATKDVTADFGIANPSFESWTSGTPDGWVLRGAAGITQSADAHTGVSSAQLLGDYRGIGVDGWGPILEANIGNQYEVSAWFKLAQAPTGTWDWGGAKIGLTIWGAGDYATAPEAGWWTETNGGFNATDWTQHSLAFTVDQAFLDSFAYNGTPMGISLSIGIYGAWASANGGVLIDDVKVTWLNAPDTGPHPGDANLDGKVSVGDLGILAANYGATGLDLATSWGKGDFNADGNVSVGDLGILAANYGWGTAAVPEPMTVSLLGLAVLALRRRR